jgi:hypothetical protein
MGWTVAGASAIIALRRGESVIDGWNDRCQPLIWTKPADEILTMP